MLQGTIIRGTTPVHDFELPYPSELVKDARISYVQNNQEVLTKSLDECTITNNVLSIALTQEETFLFMPKSNVSIEIKIQLIGKKVVRNEEPIELRIVDTINKEVFS